MSRYTLELKNIIGIVLFAQYDGRMGSWERVLRENEYEGPLDMDDCHTAYTKVCGPSPMKPTVITVSGIHPGNRIMISGARRRAKDTRERLFE